VSGILHRTWIFFLATSLFSVAVFARGAGQLEWVAIGDLPREARQTLALIKQGGPFPYAKDGIVFGNYEGILPKQRRGYYHEFTVPTQNARNRGGRRIIVGGDYVPSRERYYTADHYASFKRIQE
jgi:ribonuclease T1